MFVVVQTISAKYHLSPFLLPEIKEAPCVIYSNSSGLPWDSDDFDDCSWEVYGYLEFWSKCKSAFQHQGSRFVARKWLFSGFVLNILTKIKKSWFLKACSVLDCAKLLWPSMRELDLDVRHEGSNSMLQLLWTHFEMVWCTEYFLQVVLNKRQ